MRTLRVNVLEFPKGFYLGRAFVDVDPVGRSHVTWQIGDQESEHSLPGEGLATRIKLGVLLGGRGRVFCGLMPSLFDGLTGQACGFLTLVIE